MTYGTYAFGKNAGKLTADSVQRLSLAVTGLNEKQTRLVLSTRGLTTAQQNQVLVENGLIATSDKISASIAFQNLQKMALSQTEKEQLLIELGLMDADSKRLLTENACTEAELRATLVKKGYIGVAQDEMVANILGNKVRAEGVITWELLSASIKKAAISLWTFLTTNPIGVIAFSAGAIFGLSKAYEALTTSTEEYEEILEKQKQEYQDIVSEIDGINNELKTTNERLTELASKDKLTFTEQEEYDNLVKTNDELQREIDLLKLREKESNKELRQAFISTMSSDMSAAGEYHYDAYNGKIKSGMAQVRNDERSASEKEYINQQLKDYQKNLDKITELEEKYTDDIDNKQYLKDKKRIEEHNKKISDYINKKSTEFSTRMDGIEYIQSPLNDDERKVNEWLDYINDFQDKMAIAMDGDNAKTNAFNRLINNWQFDETLNKLEDLGKQGQVTADMLNDPDYKVFIDKLAEIGVVDAATDIDEIALAFNNLANSIDGVNNSLNTKTSIDSLKESLAETYDGAYSDTLDNVSKIEEAMQSMAEGELLDFDSMWEIYNMDTYGLIGMVKQVGDEYSMSTVDIIRLKDKLLSLMREELELEKEKAVQNKINAESELRQIEKSLREAEGKFPTPNIMELKERQEELNKEIYDYNQLINKVNLSQEALNAHLGDTIDYTEKLQAQLDKYEEEVDKLQEQADAMLEAQTDKIDDIIEKHESEKEILENQKESLEEQLELLEEQQEELEEIIDNYETVADYIGDVIQKEIDTIEDSRQKIEDYYDSQIERIQNANESRQEAIDLEEKLAAYQNAQKNKVKIYKAGAGYVYATDKEAVTDARNEYLSAQRDKKVSDLEKEKESAISGYDEQVKALESYADKWKEVSEGVVDAENSALAEQILGVEWRAKIKAQDTDILNKFSSNYLSYKSKLDSLVNGEMASLQKSIEAKEDEIKAKEAQIDSWENYKSEIERIATEIENTWNGYNNNLANIALNENSSYTDRLNNLQAFANSYGEITKEIEGYNKQITDTQAMLDEIDNNSKSNDIKLGVSSPSASPNSRLSSLYNNLSKTLIGIFERLILSLSGRNMGGTGTFMTRMFTGDINANGGVNSKTGFTWMDGTTSSSEVTFNAADAKKLYDFVHNTRSLSSVFAENFMKSLNKADNKLSATSKNPVNISIDAHIENVNANDVSDFADKWEGHMNKYMDKLYTESKVYSPVK